MKKIISVSLCLMLMLSVTACGGNDVQSTNFSNNNSWCQIGNTIFFYNAFSRRVLNFNSDTAGSLCHDPLCDHNSYDSACINNPVFMIWMSQTDGTRLYLAVWNLINGPRRGGIYSYDIEDARMKLLAETETTSHSGIFIQYYDGYIYYTSAQYKSEVLTGIDEVKSESVCYYRVPAGGGKPEQVFDGQFNVNSHLAVDDENYYLYDCSYWLEQRNILTVINRKSGKRTYIGADGEFIAGAAALDGKMYFVVCDKEEYIKFESDGSTQTAQYSIYRHDNGELTKCIENIEHYAFSGGKILYTEFTELKYLGSFTDEMGIVTDMITTSDGRVMVWDTATGDTATYQSSGTIYPIAISSDGVIIVRRQDPQKVIDTGAYVKEQYVRLTPREDGTLDMTTIE